MKLSPYILLACFLAVISFSVGYSQSVGINTVTPDSSAALEIESTSQGLLIPRMNTAQRTGIDDPAEGLLVFDSEAGSFWYFQNSTWQELRAGAFKNVNGVVKNAGDHASDDFVFGADELPQDGVTSDTLFFFDKTKGAFRTGSVYFNSNWSPDSIGQLSFASGYSTKASGYASVAMGFATNATGFASIAMGDGVRATGFNSMAIGSSTKAKGAHSIAAGQSSTAHTTNSLAFGFGAGAIGEESIAIGYFSKAYGDRSVALGDGAESHGNASAAFGSDTEAKGDYSTATGISTIADAYASTSLGSFNIGGGNDTAWVAADPIFEVGIGESYGSRENAVTILKDGTVAFKEYTFPNADGVQNQVLKTDGSGQLGWQGDLSVFAIENGVVKNTGDHASEDFVFGAANLPPTAQQFETLLFFDKSKGAFRVGLTDSTSWEADSLGTLSFATGSLTKATGYLSSAFGQTTTASGSASTAFGQTTTASGYTAAVFGSNTRAQGSYSAAFGLHTDAIGTGSMAMGQFSQANGDESVAMGIGSESNGYGSQAMGFFTEANGVYSLATGDNAVAQGTGSVAMGKSTEAIGKYSLATSNNTDAIGDFSIAGGWSTKAIGDASVSIGDNTTAGSFASLVLGRYNVGLGNDSAWIDTDPILEVGTGTSSSNRSNAITVLKNGKTGIGTHLPDQLLDVRGTSQIKLNSSGSSPHLILHEESTSDFARLRFVNNNTETHWTIAGKPEADTISSALNFYLQGVGNIMSVQGSYRVGIRSTSPESALHIDAKPNDNGLRVQLNNNTRFLVLKNGGISMGANNNDVTNSDVYIANQLYFSGVNNLPTHRIHLPNDSDDADGKGLAYEWAVYSDGRVKKNVEPLAYGLADVLKLNPVSYNHHSSQFNTNGLQLANEFESEIGFIAQEVHQVIAEAVNQPTNENEALWSMDYERLVPVLVKAIQELASDNNDLLHQLELQTELNQRYESRLTQLESIMAQIIAQGDSDAQIKSKPGFRIQE